MGRKQTFTSVKFFPENTEVNACLETTYFD